VRRKRPDVEKFYPALSAEFARLLGSLAGRRLVVIGHARPDGDCIGSQVALARVLAARGFDVVCVNPDPIPRRLQFLVAGMTFLGTDHGVNSPDDRAAIFVDFADPGRDGGRAGAPWPWGYFLSGFQVARMDSTASWAIFRSAFQSPPATPMPPMHSPLTRIGQPPRVAVQTGRSGLCVHSMPGSPDRT